MKEKKLEVETQLNADTMVRKSDIRIVFRGKLDSLSANFILAQKLFKDLAENDIYEYFNDFHNLIQKMTYSDVMLTKMDDFTIFNLDEATLREMSHHPKKYFGINHLFGIDATYSTTVLTLNTLRTLVRELELTYISVLDLTGKTECEIGVDKCLNRMSSAIYILMCVYASGTEEKFKDINKYFV